MSWDPLSALLAGTPAEPSASAAPRSSFPPSEASASTYHKLTADNISAVSAFVLRGRDAAGGRADPHQQLITSDLVSKGFIVNSVPTDAGSAPAESLLLPIAAVTPATYWFAPPRTRTVEIVLAMPLAFGVSELLLVVDRLGIAAVDSPTLSASIGYTLCAMESLVCDVPLVPRDSAGGRAHAGSVLRIKLRDGEAKIGSLVSVKLSLSDAQIAADVRLHLMRLHVVGTVIAQPRRMLSTEDAEAYRQRMASTAWKLSMGRARVASQQVRDVYSRTNEVSARTIETLLESGSVISGFTIEPTYADEGALSQVRVIKVGIHDAKSLKDGGSRLSIELSLPMVQQNTQLTYLLDEPVACTRIQMELKQSYGSLQMGSARVSFLR